MSFFDRAYDNMDWGEVCCRLPAELAVKALKRRIISLETLDMFFEATGVKTRDVKELKDHINELLTNSSLDDILSKFDQSKHPVLFNWLNDDNKKRIQEGGKEELDIAFRFNLVKSDDAEELSNLLDAVLDEDLQDKEGSRQSSARIRSVLEKADTNVFRSLVERILADSRPEVRVCILALSNYNHWASLSDNQKIIALKALSKEQKASLPMVGSVSHKLFAELRPLERLNTLEKYLSYYPSYRKLTPFKPECSTEEFHMLLFAESIAHHDRVVALNERFKDIVERDPPVADDLEDDD